MESVTPVEHAPVTTPEKILQAARGEFIAHGFAGARIQRIAQTSGANKAMIYYYFSSKENLYRNVIKSIFLTILNGVKGIISGDAPLEDKIRDMVDFYVNFYGSNRNFLRLVLHELAEEGKFLRQVLEELETILGEIDFAGVLSSTLLEGQREGKLRPVEPKHTLMSLVGMSAVFIIFRPVAAVVLALGPEEADRFAAERSRHIKDLLLNGILKK